MVAKHPAFKPVHPFPARMAPSIALDELPDSGRKPLRVLDPMAGSGTTLVVARSRGHQAIGFDTDPLARLIADVWCMEINQSQIRNTAGRIYQNAREAYLSIKQADAYPRGADEDTRAFVRYWFDLTNRKQLRALADEIECVRNANERKVFWCAFSRLIIAKARGASLAMDLSHSRPHRVDGKEPFRPIPNFINATEVILRNSPFLQQIGTHPKATIKRGDARKIPLPDGSVDVAITSPPYLNAIDYMRCNKFSLVWMGYSIPKLRVLRSGNIGTEAAKGATASNPALAKVLTTMGDTDALPTNERNVLARYIEDMDTVLEELHRVLAPGGRCVLVLGDCTIRGVFLSNSKAFRLLGKEHGFEVVKRISRPLPDNRRYLPPPSSSAAGKQLQQRMRKEVVLTLRAA